MIIRYGTRLNYNAEAGYVYKVSYDAYASGDMVGKKVNCDSKEYSGWSTYGVTQFTLENTPKSYEFLIDQTEDFENCRIEFNIGSAGTGSVYVSNVKVEIVDPDSISREEAKRTMLSDGNFIYNGSFDQGNKHLGYWSVAEGTTVSVPRYTTEKLADGDVSVVDVASKTNYEHIANGIKYYERRAQISAAEGTAPTIFQPDLKLIADTYRVNFDLYSTADQVAKVAIYSTKIVDEAIVLDECVVATDVTYEAANAVSEKSVSLALASDVENAALAFIFADGSSVQLDNVSLYGENQGPTIEKYPLNSTTTWVGDTGAGKPAAFEKIGNNYVATEVTSGGAWYSPQYISSNFSLSAGQKYVLYFKYKVEGDTNNKIKYIIQENAGSWHVFNGSGPTEIAYDGSGASNEYKIEFTADMSLDTVHFVFGLGDSAAKDAKFTFRDVNIYLASAPAPELSKDPDITPVPVTPAEPESTASSATEASTPAPTPAPVAPAEVAAEVAAPAITEGVTETVLLPETFTENVLTPELAEAAKSGKKVSAYVEIKKADKKDPKVAKDVKKVEQIAKDNKGMEVVMFLDLSVFAKVADQSPVQVSETGKAISFTVELPKELISANANEQRIYSIIRVHEGKVTILPATFDGKNITFATDQFSTYAIVYTDKPIVVKSPKTGETSNGMFVLLFVTGAAMLLIATKKRREFEN